MNKLEQLEKQTVEAYRAQDFECAFDLFDKILPSYSESPEGLGIRMLRALAHEQGHSPNGINLQKSLADYRTLANHPEASLTTPEAALGAARVLGKLDLHANAAEAKSYALRAWEHFGDPRAMAVLGLIHWKGERDFDGAKEWYWKAFKAGSPWGLKGVANVLFDEQRMWRCAASMLGFFLAYPFLRPFWRWRTPYR